MQIGREVFERIPLFMRTETGWQRGDSRKLRAPDDLPRLLLALLGVWAFGWHLAWQMRRLDLEDPTSCMVIFRANRDAGLALALFLAAAAFL